MRWYHEYGTGRCRKKPGAALGSAAPGPGNAGAEARLYRHREVPPEGYQPLAECTRQVARARARRRPHPAEPAAVQPRRDRAWQGSARQGRAHARPCRCGSGVAGSSRFGRAWGSPPAMDSGLGASQPVARVVLAAVQACVVRQARRWLIEAYPVPTCYNQAHPAALETPAVATALLTTKLFVPPVRPSRVPRPRLTERLHGGADWQAHADRRTCRFRQDHPAERLRRRASRRLGLTRCVRQRFDPLLELRPGRA